MNQLKKFIASGFYSGYCPVLPGTLASFLALIFHVVIMTNDVILTISSLVIVIAVLIFLTFYLYEFAFDEWGNHDASEFVLDEMIGYLTTALIVTIVTQKNIPFEGFATISLILFRIFDMIKIWPANILDKKEGPIYVIMDDVVAAIYAAIIIIMLT